MKEWQSKYFVGAEDRTPKTHTWYVFDKQTGEKVFPATRKYGYGSHSDALRGAAHIYRHYLKTVEKIERELCGQ